MNKPTTMRTVETRGLENELAAQNIRDSSSNVSKHALLELLVGHGCCEGGGLERRTTSAPARDETDGRVESGFVSF